MKILAGNSNLPLAQKIARNLGVSLAEADISRFADGEAKVEIKENIRGKDIYIIQSTSNPANDNLMELLVCLDALKRASAGRIIVVLPYFGYARQDRKASPRTPISAKLVADMITLAGASSVVCLDLHAMQVQGYFDIAVDNLLPTPVFVDHIKANYELSNLCIVSPDVGGVARARSIAKRLNVDLAIVDKRREKAGQSEVMNIIGNIENKDCIIVDDIVDTAGTLCNAAAKLKEEGAKSVSAYITHGVLSLNAVEKINNSALEKLVITDSIAATKQVLESSKIEVLSVSDLIAEAIRRISEETSVSSMFA
jgi:ribose-phosphate pyrophosphokinase